jgi:hypothetical protein
MEEAEHCVMTFGVVVVRVESLFTVASQKAEMQEEVEGCDVMASASAMRCFGPGS